MNDKKNVLMAAVLAFCIASTLFAMIAYGAQPYNPWWDLTEDGKIDIADLARESAAFGTLGNPAKNVTIAGRASKLAYSVSNVVIPATGWFTSDPILVEGYSKMTVSLAFTEPEFDYWLWSGHSNSSFAFVADEFDETALGVVNCKTYDVMNMYIKIRVRNPGAFEGYLSLDVYLIP